MKIAVSTDHAGFKELIPVKEFLLELGHECLDFGPKVFDANDDYPDYILPAARAVSSGKCERGIILGGSGQGEAIVANRIKGVRAALFYSQALPKGVIDIENNTSNDPYEIIRLSREHNNTNVLSLSSRFLSLEEMKTAINIWLSTPFSDYQRHARRINKIDGNN